MARRRKKDSVPPALFFKVLIVLGVIWLVVRLLEQPGIDLGLLIVVAVAIAYLVMRHRRLVRVRGVVFQKAHVAIEQQIHSLIRRRAQLVQEDAYGRQQMERWAKEIDYFITNHIEPSLSLGEQAILRRERTAITQLIESNVAVTMQDQPAFQAFSDDMTPAEFERFCAEELRRAGWNARVTMQSRDQGVDVVAEKNDTRVVLQCKLYAGPVGNKAVQEAAAAKAYEQANYGVVVTNNRYTAAADQLASSNGILLLHYRDLPGLENILLSKGNTMRGGR